MTSSKRQSITKQSLTIRYVMALLLICSLATVGYIGQVFMNQEFDKTQKIAQLVSRQRALVNRIAFLTQTIAIAPEGSETEHFVQELGTNVATLADSLHETDVRLAHSYEPVLGIFSNSVQSVYYSASLGLREKLASFVELARGILAEASSPKQGRPKISVQVISELSTLLDTVATMAQLESDQRRITLQRLELAIYVLIVLCLVGIGFLLFRPMVRAVMDRQDHLNVAKEHLEQRALELSKSRAVLRKQSRIFKSILNTMGDAVIVVDESGRLILQNPAADRLFGTMAEGMGATEWLEKAHLYDGESRSPVLPEHSPIFVALEGRKSRKQPIIVNNPASPHPVVVSAIGRLMVDDDGRSRGAVITFHDITARIQTEEELKSAKAKAEEANVAKTEFLANMSHEIRTPMGAILGYADKMLNAALPDEEKQHCIRVIRRNGRILMELIDDLLDVSKIEAGQLQIEAIPVETQSVLADVYSLLQCRAQEKQLDLSVTFDTPVPRTVTTDPVRLRQILFNVIGNAIKFTDRGAVTVSVRLTENTDTGGHGSRLEFEVRDTGCGIAPEKVQRLYKPFVQADSSTTRKFGGTGLGLALSKRLARLLGGDLFLAQSVVGEGSTFMVYIDPGAIEDTDMVESLNLHEPHGEDEPRAHSYRNELEGLRILVVEDGPENRELFEYYLEAAGASVDTAVDGLQGVDKALSNTYDIVLMDIQMPRLDGYQAVSMLREQMYPAPIVALTAHALKNEREKCKEAGFDEHVAKPVDVRQLIRTVKALTGPLPAPTATVPRVAVVEAPPRDSNGKASAENAAPGGVGFLATATSPRVRQIIDRFVMELPERVQEIREACAVGDNERLGRLIHKLKGAAGACGFSTLMDEVARYEEDILRQGPVKTAEALRELDRLEGATREVVASFSREA